MRIVLIGYGKMGKAIEKIANERGHQICEIVDIGESHKLNSDLVKVADLAIEFTNPESAKNNVLKCLSIGIPIVSGTTGWTFDNNEVENLCKINKTAFFYASNFSLGANIFMNINERLAELLSKFDNYSASIYETHHIHKLDKPSGTAISLAKGIIENNPKYVKAELNPISDIRNLEIFSFRDGEIIGDHKVIWESEVDKITIEHSAKNRNGLAIGAIIAAEYLDNKIGVYTIKDLLNL